MTETKEIIVNETSEMENKIAELRTAPVITTTVSERRMLAELAKITDEPFKITYYSTRNKSTDELVEDIIRAFNSANARRKNTKGSREWISNDEKRSIIRKAATRALRAARIGEVKQGIYSKYSGNDEKNPYYGLNSDLNYFTIDHLDNDNIKSFDPELVTELQIGKVRFIKKR